MKKRRRYLLHQKSAWIPAETIIRDAQLELVEIPNPSITQTREEDLLCENVENNSHHVATIEYLQKQISSKIFLCKKCDGQFLSGRSLARHKCQGIKENYQLRITEFKSCGNQEQQQQEEKPKPKESKARTFMCEICEQQYTSPGFLARHRCRESQESAQFCCRQCKRRFKTKAGIKQHSLTHNKREGEKGFACDDCRKEFDTEGSLKKHVGLCGVRKERLTSQMSVAVGETGFNGELFAQQVILNCDLMTQVHRTYFNNEDWT